MTENEPTPIANALATLAREAQKWESLNSVNKNQIKSQKEELKRCAEHLEEVVNFFQKYWSGNIKAHDISLLTEKTKLILDDISRYTQD
jgi:hypothetical protein